MAPSVNLVRYASCPDEPWRNGAGRTRTLWSEGRAGAPTARISVAELARAAPFSHFAGIDRTFCSLGPGRVVLIIEGARHELGFGEWVSFAGEAAVSAELPDGPVRAFNIMTQRAAANHSVSRTDAATPGALLAALTDGGLADAEFKQGDLILEPHPFGLAGQFLAIHLEL